MMGLVYCNEANYIKHKAFFIEKRMSFEEIRNSNSKYLKVGKSKFYLSPDPKKDTALAMNLHELKLIQDIKKEVLLRYEKEGPFPDVCDMKMYIGVKMDLFEHIETDDIWEIDITAAYPTQAKIMNLICDGTYDRFFEKETNPTHRIRKMELRRKYNDHSYFSQGECLRFSKKCRLISLGSLATKKEITYYREGVMCETITEYDREQANIFYSLAYNVGRKMMDITKEIEGVYFWWVDAIFCNESAKNEVIKSFESSGYNVKVKKLEYMSYYPRMRRAEIVKDETGDLHPYFFSSKVTLEHHETIMETFKDVDNLIEWYKRYLEYPELAVKKVRDYVKNKYGEVTTEKVVFTEMCKSLNIDSPNDINLKWLSKFLKNRGLDVSDFIQIKSIVKNVFYSKHIEEIFGKDDLSYDLITCSSIIQNYSPKKVYESNIEETEGVHEKIGPVRIKTLTHQAIDNLNVKMSII